MVRIVDRLGGLVLVSLGALALVAVFEKWGGLTIRHAIFASIAAALAIWAGVICFHNSNGRRL